MPLFLIPADVAPENAVQRRKFLLKIEQPLLPRVCRERQDDERGRKLSRG